ncbi:hypothetical protein N7462_009471 [Penicillium macrosclerotiorum]|uniref:uncharacterized protein n=1 Tax=Penicillium macrosclerotiorum TaxID=303699 RepID=UPI002547DFB2|nr:uncharacterized protein N7462_009471 [Penicillium macrosclerotiorum]KAJ5674032.1 hypothetical protein N7462_009471 [Penicillium macrosclerotiorum]
MLRHTPAGFQRSFRFKASLRHPGSLMTGSIPAISDGLSVQDVSTHLPDDNRPSSPPHAVTDIHRQRENQHPESLISRRRFKKYYAQPKPTPSEYLAKALKHAGHALGSVGYSTKKRVGRSSFGPGQDASRDALQTLNMPRLTYGRPQNHSFQTTLAEYIRLVDPILATSTASDQSGELDKILSQVFRESSHRFLTSRGYDIEDVVAWAWILKSKDTCQAISRLFALEMDYGTRFEANYPRVPPFIALFLLKEDHLDVRSFRLLVIYSLHLLSGQPLPPFDYMANYPARALEPLEHFRPRIDPSTGAHLVARMIRHARLIWPQALPTLARALARFLMATDAETQPSRLSKDRSDHFKTDKLNACLWLISLPTKIYPFRSTSIQQQAQFELLRAMASHKPVLPLSRQGYRAVVAVQVAHKKTTAERQSAELKAPSWPPWKEERMGIDALRGNEGVYSRAMNVLSQMREAGYSPRLWEDIASILTGWDTDRSPTIQTRSLVSWSPSVTRARQSNPDNIALWTARIRATRTVREAWACFLSYQDLCLPPKPAMYTAMAEKLIYRQRAIKTRFDETSNALPGDGPEVHPEPASARDIIYVHTEPPVLREFLDQMLSHGFRFSGRFLALLLRSAPNIQTGLRYLHCSDLTEDQIRALCTVRSHPSEYDVSHLTALQSVPDYIFASFIQLLCARSSFRVWQTDRRMPMDDRFPLIAATDHSHTPTVLLPDFEDKLRHRSYPKALWHALQLTRARQAPCAAAWSTILKTLGDERISRKCPPGQRYLNRILAWHETLIALRWMKSQGIDPTMEGFYGLCTTFRQAVDAGMRHPDKADESFMMIEKAARGPNAPIKICGQDFFDAMVENGLQVLKSLFDSLVLPTSNTTEVAEHSVFSVGSLVESELHVPSVLHVPSFAVLHSFVRVLGTVLDDDGLLHLLRWMGRTAAPLNEVSDELLNGEKMRRQTLTAIRVFLERRHIADLDAVHDDRVAAEKVQEAYDIICRAPGWDWPSDAEIEEYCMDQ